MIHDVLIVGGGAAGLAAAGALARRGRRVALLERQPRVGRKLLSTGNGRCNLTHVGAAASDYHGSRQAARMALKAWPPERVTAWFEDIGVPCTADDAGRVYPMSRQAASVLDALRLCCDEHGVQTLTGFAVARLERDGNGFIATAEDGRSARARFALVCAGGLAAPKLGATGDGYRLLEGFGHRIEPRFPAIAALRTSPERVRGLKGVRAEGGIALLADGGVVREERGEILLTEYGVSGIAAMQLARAAHECLRKGAPCAVRMNFAPDWHDAAGKLADRARALERRPSGEFLNGVVPRLLGQALAKAAKLDAAAPAGSLTRGQIAALAEQLSGWTLPVSGTQGFDQAQVTAGGASLKDFDMRTMQSLRAPGLFAAGEVLDVDGDCGGFNLQWAWSSALTAADAIDAQLEKE